MKPSPITVKRADQKRPPFKLTRQERKASLEAMWLRLRLELVQLMDGTTVNYDPQGGHQKPGTSRPPMAGTELRHFDRVWRGAKSDADRRRILLCPDCAQEGAKPGGAVLCCVIGCLRSFKFPNEDIRKRRDTREWREAVANDPLPCRAVARRWGVKVDSVLAWRREFLPVPPRPGRPRGAAS